MNNEVYTGGDIFFWLKAITVEDRHDFAELVTKKGTLPITLYYFSHYLLTATEWGKVERTDGFHRKDRTILGGFVDGITNPIEPALASHCILYLIDFCLFVIFSILFL